MQVSHAGVISMLPSRSNVRISEICDWDGTVRRIVIGTVQRRCMPPLRTSDSSKQKKHKHIMNIHWWLEETYPSCRHGALRTRLLTLRPHARLLHAHRLSMILMLSKE